MEKLLVSKNEVCFALGWSRDKLDKEIRLNKKFPRPVKMGRSRQSAVFFKVEDIEQYVDELPYQNLDDVKHC